MKLKDNSTQEIDTALYQLEQKLKSNIRLTDVENSNASTAKINAVDKKLTEEVKDRQSADEKLQDNINKEIADRQEADAAIENAKQDKLIAGDNIQINGNIISATSKEYTAEAPVKVTDGKISLDTVPVDKGGTGVTTQADINKAFIGDLTVGNDNVTDGTEFVSSYASDNGFAETSALNKPYKRQFIKVWNYIKDKISSVLGLTSAKVLSYDSHLSNKDNPHSVTKSQVGLDSVVNTGDSATPVSGGTTKFTTGGAYTELNKKVDKVNGKGLSSNDFTNTYKDKLDNIDTTVTTNSSNLVTSGAVATAISTEVTNRNTAITNAINNLDVSSVGGDGKYISAISETNGKISATSTTMDTAPTTNSVKAVTSGGIKTAISTAETNAKNLANATGTLPVANGGTGKTTANAAANSFINSLTTGESVPEDNDYFISQSVSGGTTTTTYHRRPLSLLWNYIKGKISNVLGLTKDNYGGKASTAATADSANKIEPKYTKSLSLTEVTSGTIKYVKIADCNWDQSGTLQVYLGGNSLVDTLVINFGGGNATTPMLCGYYHGNNHMVSSVIAQNGSNWNSAYSIYVKVRQQTTCSVHVALLKGICTINITESTTAPKNISEWAVNYGFFGTLAGKSAKSGFLDEYPGAGSTRLTSGNIKPKDSSEWGGMRKDVVTSRMTDSGRPGADGHLLTMFWDNTSRFDAQFYISDSNPPVLKSRGKANGTDYGPWIDIITSNNIGSQTVANATNARTNADQGFLCKLYTLESATSDATAEAYNVILLGKIPDPASTAAPASPSTSWDIDVDFYFVRSQGHKASWCNVKAGYGYSNAWRKYGSIETFGVDSNSNYTYPFDLVTLKYNNEYYIGVSHTINIDGNYAARVKYVNIGGGRNPPNVNNTPLVNMLKVIPYQKTNGTILNNEIKTSIAYFPNKYAPTVIRNGSLVLPSGNVTVGNRSAAGSRLTIQGATVNSNSYADTNPKLEFKNDDGSQNISLTFNEWDSVQAPASLTLNGNQGDEYFIAPNIKATTKFIGNVSGNSETATTANKVRNALTINGQSFDGSSAVNISIQDAYDHIVHDGDSLLEWANCTDGSMKKVLIKSGTYNITKGVNLSQAGTGYVLAEQGAVINSHVPIAFTASSGKTVAYSLNVVCDGAANGDNTCAFSASDPENLILYNCSATYRAYTEIVNRNLFVSCTCYNCSYAFQNLPANSSISMKVFYQCRCYNCKCKQTIEANSSTGIIFDSESYFYKECHCASCDAELTTSRNIKSSTKTFACYYNCYDRCVGCLSKINVNSKALTVYSTLYGFIRCQYMSSCKETHTEGYSNIKGIVQCDYISSTTGINGGSNTHVGNSCNIH